MNVEVTVVTSVPPTAKDLDDLRLAASALASKQDSIAVDVREEKCQFLLTASFKMKTTAQYKVVDLISAEFEYYLVSLKDYQETIISFPR
ncbi:hypothetical protein IQ273_09755 [Nodosilinea sp. LEGE 07298]|uniref:hypothetical protein n=1 Tax=Nodosilinea sp. LEGE 07298 TaxID=2777970 RepID=UPI00187E184B|nr:hypothetical protein [Nodosilinea sp. LEGE 07298]MBE9109697.1 hypothetical protein [Nodosilinea sp. LEGE 07298]